jgi:predicted membrane protein
MKDEVRRIMQLVKDGKLSPEDAAELIEAFQDAPDQEPAVSVEEPAVEEPAGDSKKSDDPFAKLIGSIEKVTKEVAGSIDWKDISNQVRLGVGKGVDAIKEAANEASKGKGPFGSIFTPQVSRTVELPLQVPEGKLFKVEAFHGDIRIEGGHDIGSVLIEAGFRSFNNQEAQEMADRFTPSLEESDDAVTLKQMEQNGVIADIVVKLAKGTAVSVRSATGDIHVSDTGASVKVTSSSGDVRIEQAGGAVEVNLSSGEVRVRHSDLKSSTIETKSGDVLLDHVNGSANVRTASGDVTLYGFRGSSLAIEAASGDVTADLLVPVTGTTNIRTVSGDVTLHVPDGSDARVSVSTLRGEVNCTLPLIDEVKEPMKVTGRLGEGSGLLDVSAVNGDLFVALAGSEVKSDDEPAH